MSEQYQSAQRITLPEFLNQFPWQPNHLERGKSLDWLWHFDIGTSVEKLWPYLVDTSRLNRSMGFPKMDFIEKEGLMHGTTSYWGVKQDWVEIPWNWVHGKYVVCIREYSRGLAHTFRGIFSLQDLQDDKTTRVNVYFGWIPRGLTGRLYLQYAFPQLERFYRRALTYIEKHLQNPSLTQPYKPVRVSVAAEAHERAVRISEDLAAQGVPEHILDRLVQHVETGDNMELYRIQVLPLAKKWDIPWRDLLVSCLHATRAGLLVLSWDVICPHCRGVRYEARSLAEIPVENRCDVCKIDFRTDTEHSIEVTFHVHPSLRKIPELFYCSAEPSTKPHIKLQHTLNPGENVTANPVLTPGRYRLRVQGKKESTFLNVFEDSTVSGINWKSTEGMEDLECSKSPSLHLSNPESQPVTVVMEDTHWGNDSLKPVHLFTLHEFHDLFSEEYLSLGIQLNIGEQTILFTDIVASTVLFEQFGDARAFVTLRDHFVKINDVVRKYNGAMIKTIGDAAMAAFHQPQDAARAAFALQDEFRGSMDERTVRLRIAVNAGPCIAVHFNTGIDYFGKTVIAAARMQKLVGPGQIAFSKKMLELPGVGAEIEKRGAVLKEVELKGTESGEQLTAFRVERYAKDIISKL